MWRDRGRRLPVHLGEVELATDEVRGVPVDGPVRLLVRHGTRVLGELRVAAGEGRDPAAVIERCRTAFADALWSGDVVEHHTPPLDASDVSIVICTRDRPTLLAECLAAIGALEPPPGAVIVVDSASTTDATGRVAEEAGATLHRLEVPGLDRARNVGWQAAAGDVVLYVDDDALLDRRAAQVAASTMVTGSVAAVTGLVLPAEVATMAQLRFERRDGMSKGFRRKLFNERVAPVGFKTYAVGVGACMAFRRSVLADIGGFDPLLDVGTETRGAGDFDAFFRVLEAGHTIVYEPSLVARHVHRRTHRAWLRQMIGYGYGYTGYLEKHRWSGNGAATRELRRWHLHQRGLQLSEALVHRRWSDVVEKVAEGYGSLFGARAYRRERDRQADV